MSRPAQGILNGKQCAVRADRKIIRPAWKCASLAGRRDHLGGWHNISAVVSRTHHCLREYILRTCLNNLTGYMVIVKSGTTRQQKQKTPTDSVCHGFALPSGFDFPLPRKTSPLWNVYILS
jgi:hypothetical protein